MTTTRVLLTGPQAEQVRWALGPMDDYWCSEGGGHERDGPIYPESDLPRLEETSWKKTPAALVLSPHTDINADLLYRLEVQLQDMADAEPDQAARGAARAGLKAAETIRRRCPELAELPEGGGYV